MHAAVEEWLQVATQSGKFWRRVSPQVTRLSCGCRRELGDPEFIIQKISTGWVHSDLGCQSIILTPLEVDGSGKGGEANEVFLLGRVGQITTDSTPARS